jgi:hypothetical protein
MYFSSAVAVKAEFTLDCKAIKRFPTAIFGSVQKTVVHSLIPPCSS